MSEIKAVLFDVFGTVVDWRGSLIRVFSAFGAEHGLTADWAGLVDAWRGAYRPSLDRVRRGDVGWCTLDVLHRASLDALLPRFGLASLDEAQRAFMVRAWHALDPWPDVIEGLFRLKKRVIIGTLSNGHTALLVNMAKRAGLPWDVVFGADMFRHYKPDPETYLGAAALLDLRPEEVMLAAAHPSDLAAARAVGLRSAYIPRPLEHGPGHASPPPPEGVDVTAESVGALAAWLEGA
jgi:2-haloacid dehalogenase